MAANKRVGEVEFTIGSASYVARFGNKELASLENQWNVAGLRAIYMEGCNTSQRRFIEFCRAALVRHQPQLTFDDVADLLDYRDESGTLVAADAVGSAFQMILPKEKTSAGTTETNQNQAGPRPA